MYLEKWAYETTEFLCRSLKLLGQDVKYLMYAVSWMLPLFYLKCVSKVPDTNKDVLIHVHAIEFCNSYLTLLGHAGSPNYSNV